MLSKRLVASGDSTDSRVFDILLDMGYDINAPRHSSANHSTGQLITPLGLACDRLQQRSVDLLLRVGAKPNGVGDSFWIRKVDCSGLSRAW
ncbi:hypothetical protein F5B22DRAFT_342756 [Xylaria bambusicola]|uniref:uncharacterized protein n=1 Tax=Xylaria bambusicola TaxID=326684 RepID=UPI00200735B6|nr:uncharacterized protein F5B22DRAFT_342756 [Xylaria bambusicola]KAI0525463.1 hypothetical protein F5B22DRAFT_342756 [Xylaria bambusicola]